MTVTRPVQTSLIEGMEKPVGPILPSVFKGTNADLMAAVAPLYLTGSVLDVTYGEGKWWDRFTPDPFAFHDLHKVDGVDFTALPEGDASFDTVCFDPPYVLSGGKSTGKLADEGFQNRYGIGNHNLANGSASNATLPELIQGGLAEAIRVSRQWVLVKCMEFVGSAEFCDMPWLVRKWALDLGVDTHDVIVHHTGSGPGGHNIFTVKRARRHHSYLLVFKKATRRAVRQTPRCQGCEDAPVGVAVVHDATCAHDEPEQPKCAQEIAGFGPPCSDPMCEACRG